MHKMTVRLTFVDELLGSSPADTEIYSSYIASKAPDAETMAEELESLSVEEMIDKKMTVFLRNSKGDPCVKNHQIKGFLKGACSSLQRAKGEASAKKATSIKAYKKVVDTNIAVMPKFIKIHNIKTFDNYERSLRAQTAQGDRIALANSERVSEGAYIEFSIIMDYPLEDLMAELLDHGIMCGLGQNRGAGFGRFTWEDITPPDEKALSDSGNMTAQQAFAESSALKSGNIWK